jgi:hypothetical protein
MDPARQSSAIYKHERLDHTKASMRLLRILPDLSDTGLIQCEIWHDTTAATYDCLSYVWGTESAQQTILVNEKVFYVRNNLWNFINVARTRYAVIRRAFWIDALCIDQEWVAERNHQVAQMGTIYSNAAEVIAWLGVSTSIERAFRICLELGALSPPTTAEAWELWDCRNVQSNWQLGRSWHEVLKIAYWKRAWITQEILLARNFKFLVNYLEVDPTNMITGRLLPGILKGGSGCWPEGRNWTSDTRVLSTYLEALCNRKTIAGRKLIELLHELPSRESKYPRDRVYSLLAIATDTATFPVDYASSDYDLLHHLRSLCCDSFCLCVWSYLANTLELRLAPAKLEQDWRLTYRRRPIRSKSTDTKHSGLRFCVPMVAATLKWKENTRKSGSQRYAGERPQSPTTCSNCGKAVTGSARPSKLLCVETLCNRVWATHFHLREYESGDQKGYTISAESNDDEWFVDVVCRLRHDLLTLTRFHQALMRLKHGDQTDSLCCYSVYIEPDILIGLLQRPVDDVDLASAPVEFCSNALQGSVIRGLHGTAPSDHAAVTCKEHASLCKRKTMSKWDVSESSPLPRPRSSSIETIDDSMQPTTFEDFGYPSTPLETPEGLELLRQFTMAGYDITLLFQQPEQVRNDTGLVKPPWALDFPPPHKLLSLNEHTSLSLHEPEAQEDNDLDESVISRGWEYNLRPYPQTK